MEHEDITTETALWMRSVTVEVWARLILTTHLRNSYFGAIDQCWYLRGY